MAGQPVPPPRCRASSTPRWRSTAAILDVVRAGFLHGEMLVPAARCSASCRAWPTPATTCAGQGPPRPRGPRGAAPRARRRASRSLDDEVPGVPEVDAKLVRICLDRERRAAHARHQPGPVAALAGVRVLNLHALALSLRPPVVAGDEVTRPADSRPARRPARRVGYLDDGTMVVVERARESRRPGGRRAGDQRAHHRERPPGVRAAAVGRRAMSTPAPRRAGPQWSPRVVPAAGRGERLGPGAAKALRAARRGAAAGPRRAHPGRGPPVDLVVVAAPPDEVAEVGPCSPSVARGAELRVVAGGATRQESVRRALAALPDDVDVVLVHDAARRSCRSSCRGVVAAVARAAPTPSSPACRSPTPSSRSTRPDVVIDDRRPRRALRAVQTPQGFRRAVLEAAHGGRADGEAPPTTPAWSSGWAAVIVVPGAEEAFKVTRPLDLVLAEAVLARAEATVAADAGGRCPASASASTSTRSRPGGRCSWPGCTSPDEPAGLRRPLRRRRRGARRLRRAALGRRARRPRRASSAPTDPQWAGASGARCSPRRPGWCARPGFEIGNVAVQVIGNRPRLGPRAGRGRGGAVRGGRRAGVGVRRRPPTGWASPAAARGWPRSPRARGDGRRDASVAVARGEPVVRACDVRSEERAECGARP